MHLENDTAVAIRYDYDGPSPLKEALTKFFDGPTDLEKEMTGIRKTHACEGYDGKIFECGSSEILKSVRIENGIAYIDLSGVPGTWTSGETMEFAVPLRLTVTQFPSVNEMRLVVLGHEVGYTDSGCMDHSKSVCFELVESIHELKELSKYYGWEIE